MSEFIPGQGAPATPLSPSEQDARTGSGLAIAAFVTSLATIFLTGGFFSFIGSILGHVSLSKLKKSGSDQNRGLAVAGVIIGWVSTAIAWLLVIGFIFILIALNSAEGADWWDDLVNEFDSNYNTF